MREPSSNIRKVCGACLPPAPTPLQLRNLAVGDYVKIVRRRERFWVEITSLNPTMGRVDNDLISNPDIEFNMIIPLDISEVIQVITAEELRAKKGTVQ